MHCASSSSAPTHNYFKRVTGHPRATYSNSSDCTTPRHCATVSQPPCRTVAPPPSASWPHQIARTAAIFNVDELVIIDDTPQRKDGTVSAGAAFLARVAQYLETPQYLRKALIPMHPDLRLAGGHTGGCGGYAAACQSRPVVVPKYKLGPACTLLTAGSCSRTRWACNWLPQGDGATMEGLGIGGGSLQRMPRHQNH